RMVDGGRAAYAVVAGAGLPVERVDVSFELDMLYQGQTHTVPVPLPVTLADSTTGISEPIVREAFEAAYSRAFSRLLPGIPMRIVSLRRTAIGRRPGFDMMALAPDAAATREGAARGTRPVWFDGRWHEAGVWGRLALPAGAAIDGPAVLEQP